ncbi:MetS family NSS transporter small subunit [Buchananella felis]|uniref:MetS family NSS transporter small subunit n=1 Tax=Buchananella felis TaxID=3231492 RepID=UPI003528A8D0
MPVNAILLMLAAFAVVWGGLVASIVVLLYKPQPIDVYEEDGEQAHLLPGY